MKTTAVSLALLSLALYLAPGAPAADKGDKKTSPEAAQPPRPAAETGAKPSAEAGKGAPGAKAPNTKEGKMFNTYDKDGSGGVTADEIEAMREGKLSSSQRREIRKEVKTADVDKNGVLDLEEYTWWLKNRGKMSAEGGAKAEKTASPGAEG